jgi:hypothetical protein
VRGRLVTLLLIPLARRLRNWADGVLQQNGPLEEAASGPPSGEPSGPPAHWLERVSAVPPSHWIEWTAENAPTATTISGEPQQRMPPQPPRSSGTRTGEAALRLQKTRPRREALQPPAGAYPKTTPPARPLEESSTPNPDVVSSPARPYRSSPAAHHETAASYSVDRPKRSVSDPRYARLQRGKPAESGRAETPPKRPSATAPATQSPAPAPRPVNLFVNVLRDEATRTPQPEPVFPPSPPPAPHPGTSIVNRAVVEGRRSPRGALNNAPFLGTSTPGMRSPLRSPQSSQEREDWRWQGLKTAGEPAAFPATMSSSPWPELPEIPSTPHEEVEEAIHRLVMHWKLEREQTGRPWSE